MQRVALGNMPPLAVAWVPGRPKPNYKAEGGVLTAHSVVSSSCYYRELFHSGALERAFNFHFHSFIIRVSDSSDDDDFFREELDL